MAQPPPVYVSGEDYISDTEECRRLARNVVLGDFTNEQIVPWQVANYSVIRSLTGKSDWSDTDVQFHALRGIETRLTAADLDMHYGDGSTESVAGAQARKDAAMIELKDMIAATGVASTGIGDNMNMVQSAYKSWNLNIDAMIPRRRLNVY